MAKLAGAMKATMANAIRTIDALRIKKEEGSPVVAEAVVETPAVEAAVETPVVTEEVQAPVEEKE